MGIKCQRGSYDEQWKGYHQKDVLSPIPSSLTLWMAETSGLTKPIRENESLVSNNMETIPREGQETIYWLLNPTEGGMVYRIF